MDTLSQSENERVTLLIVDDEEMITSSLRAFLNLETPYHVEPFNDPRHALEFARNSAVDLAVVDYLMPGMTGLDFLLHLRDLQPEATRILLTGYADKQSAIRAINEIGLFHYVEKPWDNDNLKIIIRNGLEKRHLIKTLREKIRQLDDAHLNLKNVQTQLLKAFM